MLIQIGNSASDIISHSKFPTFEQNDKYLNLKLKLKRGKHAISKSKLSKNPPQNNVSLTFIYLLLFISHCHFLMVVDLTTASKILSRPRDF